MSLSAEEIGKLAQTLPGTVGGELLRRYWFPLAPVGELTDEAPIIPIRILSTGLVLFRNRNGAVGLIQERCTHHGVLLQYGSVDDQSLICPRHGWQFDVEGHCYLAGYQAKPFMMTWGNAKHYAVTEHAGLYWGYIGPQPAPPLPDHELLTHPVRRRITVYPVLADNWLRSREDQLDLESLRAEAHPHPTVFAVDGETLCLQRPLDDDHIWQITLAQLPEESDGSDEVVYLDQAAVATSTTPDTRELWFLSANSSS